MKILLHSVDSFPGNHVPGGIPRHTWPHNVYAWQCQRDTQSVGSVRDREKRHRQATQHAEGVNRTHSHRPAHHGESLHAPPTYFMRYTMSPHWWRYCIKYSSRCMYYVPIELSELLQHWSLILEVHIKMLIFHFKAKHELFLYSSLSWLNHNVLYFHLHMSPIVH